MNRRPLLLPLLALWAAASITVTACGTTPPDASADGGCPTCECQSGEWHPCYDGPEGTEGVGRCATGVRTCSAEGTYGACEGDVIPASESCNGVDDDCDGQVDEGFGEVTCGVGACQVTVTSCVDAGTVACEPLRPAVREACEGTDDDCDGEVDEGCACADGATQPCYGGPQQTVGVGRCVEGTQSCSGGQWGTCSGEVLPQTETCNGSDDDCDGEVDESDPVLGATCDTGKSGSCGLGLTACAGGVLQCEQVSQPTAEVCNGLDDDCDGETDQGNPGGGTSCNTGQQGLCGLGVTTCLGENLLCTSLNSPQPETCDGKDNDCDGVVDEGNPGSGQSCTTALPGACAAGTTTCAGGVLECTQTTQASAEACDGVDNDCDGTVDDSPLGLGQPCTTSLPGVCAAGTTTCSNGAVGCAQTTQSSAEACDGRDNDCDGSIDEGNPGGGASCSTGQPGVCAPGLTVCQAGALSCQPLATSSAETCDGLDNDCDGQTDENNPGGGQSCTTALPGACAAGTTTCAGGALQCAQTTQASAEACDGIDNDCDGTVDDSPLGLGQPCTTALPGVCAAGTTTCSNGALACAQTTQASAETCDGRDNDCDGSVDENNPGGGTPCSTGLPGVCAPGLTVCQAGALSCQQQAQPGTESCDGVDNDCDGLTDEGNPGGGQACSTGLPGACAAGTTACSNGQVQCVATTTASQEVCDGEDNDCDGTVDDSPVGQGQSCSTALPGVCAAGTTTCSNGAVACAQTTQPSAETCDGRDNDCDGSVDEGNPGGGTSCSTGLPGVCAPGLTVCQAGALSCQQQAQPGTESCDGVDNDCDGLTDEGNPGGGQACSTGLPGACAAGTTACSNGQVQCVATNTASQEVCDGEDNDCDGTVDDAPVGLGQPCTTALPGVCAAGTTTCSNGAVACAQTTQPSAETCDGRDNDCDGSIDEGNPGGGTSCSTGQPGVCGPGLTLCQAGALSCQQQVLASDETCDGVDNDCDGLTDENNPGGGVACNTGLPGVCAPGTTACSNGQVQCAPSTPASQELCDGVDNDCDGVIDDGNPGGGASCSTGLPGACGAGVTTCSAGGLTCEQTAQPTAEVCDGRDNDCDGSVDEGNPGAGASCVTGLPGVCAPGTTACAGGVLLCTQDTFPSQETCNLEDDDCDGQVDEGFDLSSDPNNCGACGNVCGSASGALCCNSACVIPDASNCGACGVACTPGMLVINELHIDPNAVDDTQGEWFEVYNPGAAAVDLRGFQLEDLGLDRHTVTSALPVMVPAGGYAVLGINATTATNGGVSVLYQYSSLSLGNSGDELLLLGVGGTELDRVVWTTSFDKVGVSKELSVNHRTAALNDSATNWCDATTPFGTGADKGTPGAANVCSK